MPKYGFNRRQDFIFGSIITAATAIVALILALIGLSTAVFDPIGQALGNFSLSDGFFYTKSGGKESGKKMIHDIVIVDIKDCESLEDIARAVKVINQAKPKTLAVDVIFGQYASTSAQGYELLVEAFKETPNLILAERVVPRDGGAYLERSSFVDEVLCLEGAVNFDNGMVRSFVDSIQFESSRLPSFISLIARQAGYEDFSGENLINYSPVRALTIESKKLVNSEILNDQIVLLGDTDDLRDFHDIPVLIDGKARTTGVRIHAQCLYTLQPGNGFHSCPRWLSLIIGILLTYLFCTFVASPMFRIDKFNGLWITIWQIIVILIFVVLTYILFWTFRIYMPLTYWLIGLGLSGFCTELFYFIKDKKYKR